MILLAAASEAMTGSLVGVVLWAEAVSVPVLLFNPSVMYW
jgi:hypothetical protein